MPIADMFLASAADALTTDTAATAGADALATGAGADAAGDLAGYSGVSMPGANTALGLTNQPYLAGTTLNASSVDPSMFSTASTPNYALGSSSIISGLPGLDPYTTPASISGAGSSPSSISAFIDQHPFQAAAMGLIGYNALNALMTPHYLNTSAMTPTTYAALNRQLSSNYQPRFAAAKGGIASLAAGGAPEVGAQYALSNQGQQAAPATSGLESLAAQYGVTPQAVQQFMSSGQQSYAGGGSIPYAAGGKLLQGNGDGMSDSIPADIDGQRPARLADGEFVVPADVVSHLGNGSTDAGAKQLYKMMDRVRQARTGNKAQGKEIQPGKYMPS
jgi:hypothetical protein